LLHPLFTLFYPLFGVPLQFFDYCIMGFRSDYTGSWGRRGRKSTI
jgi:hypothetical protein